jgi:nucleoside-diphosphate-sugar epimerase
MTKVGIIGANGQVGAELCLLLRGHQDIELVPVCRNRSGSAFLRWQGIACRHGRAAEAAEAAGLIGDCDIVINSSLAAGTPSQIRSTEARIIHNLFEHSKAGARVIHFSTQSVYGDPTQGRWIRWRNPYGRAKQASERQVRAAQRRFGKKAFILRLGHVCGALQDISIAIRESIRDDSVVLPATNCTSNTVYVDSIADAIARIIQGQVQPGTFDLMNDPLWTWREVYEYEAGICQVPLHPRFAESRRASSFSGAVGWASQLAAATATARPIRDLFAKVFAHVPERMNARALAWWYVRRARNEIAALNAPPQPADHLSWVANGGRFFPAGKPTIELLQQRTGGWKHGPVFPSWPADLAAAVGGALNHAGV